MTEGWEAVLRFLEADRDELRSVLPSELTWAQRGRLDRVERGVSAMESLIRGRQEGRW